MSSTFRMLRYMGVLAAASGWVTIFTAIYFNPWFVFVKNAFSDLGAPNANMPWIYNYGLMITGFLIILYSIGQLHDALNKVEAYASGFTTLTGVFLILIGIFYSGTRPHTFVSTWFFIQGDLSILAWGLGLLVRGWRRLGMIFTSLAIFSPFIGFGIPWPSAATAEAFGVVILDIWIIGMLKVHGIIG